MAAAFDIHPMARLETEHVVLVIDEAGEERFADIVRALCVCHERICCSVGQLWKCANVRMVVCGTGSEGALLAPGSLPSTYQLINIADTSTCEAFFVGAVCKALKDQMTTLEALLRPGAPAGGDEARSQVYPLLHQRSQEDAALALVRDPLLLFARRLLFNRRIAAALVRVLHSSGAGMQARAEGDMRIERCLATTRNHHSAYGGHRRWYMWLLWSWCRTPPDARTG